MDDQYDNMSFNKLKQFCRDNNIRGYSKFTRKETLKEFIRKENIIPQNKNIKLLTEENKKLKEELKELKLKECFEDPWDNESDKESIIDKDSEEDLGRFYDVNEGEDKIQFEFKEKYDDTYGTDDIATNTVEVYKTMLDSLKKQNDESQSALKVYGEKYDTLHKQNILIKKAHDDTGIQMTQLQDKYDTLHKQNILIKKAHDDTGIQMTQLQDKYDTLHKQNILIKKVHDDTGIQMTQLQDKYDKVCTKISKHLVKNKNSEVVDKKKCPKLIKEEFDNIIRNKIQHYSNVTIINSNEYHRERYNLFINKHNGHNKQIILYHGTHENNIKQIMENGFSLTNNKRHGAAHGEGIYFANDINYAMKYPVERCAFRNILICQVYVNNTIEGKHSITTFPKIPGKDDYYDTGVDILTKPNIFVKKTVEEINILGYVQIDLSKGIKPPPVIGSANIKIWNYSEDKIMNIYILPKNINIYNIDINNCKLMGQIVPTPRPGFYYYSSIKTILGEKYIVGYYDKEKHLNIVQIINVNKNTEEFIIK